jgi:hypothetical protein
LTWYAQPIEVYGCGPRRIEELETGQNRKKKKKLILDLTMAKLLANFSNLDAVDL